MISAVWAAEAGGWPFKGCSELQGVFWDKPGTLSQNKKLGHWRCNPVGECLPSFHKAIDEKEMGMGEEKQKKILVIITLTTEIYELLQKYIIIEIYLTGLK